MKRDCLQMKCEISEIHSKCTKHFVGSTEVICFLKDTAHNTSDRKWLSFFKSCLPLFIHPHVGVTECSIVSMLCHNITMITPQELTTLILALPQAAQILWQQNACHMALDPTIKATDHKSGSCLHIQCHSMSICWRRR